MVGHARRFWVVIVLTGVAAGLSAAALTLLLHVVQHAAFGYVEETFLLGVEQASAWRRVLVLAGAGVVAGVGWWLLRSRMGRSVGISQAVWVTAGRLPLVRTLLDAVLQIVVVGLGASLGREGAPREAAAAIGSSLGRGLNDDERVLIVACAAGAGLAAVYDVPLGGAIFTLEILLGVLDLDSMMAALITSVVATVTAWIALPNHPTYAVSHAHTSLGVVLAAVVLGPLAGLLAAGFVRITRWAGRVAPTGWRLMASTVVVFTALGVVSIRYPALLGNGKGPAQLAFADSGGVALLGALIVLKPLATAACLRSGARGGMFTPLLSTGAMLGGFVGAVIGVPGLAVVSATAVLAAGMQAPVTAVVVMIELTGDVGGALIPMMIAVVGAALTDRLIGGPSIYTPGSAVAPT